MPDDIVLLSYTFAGMRNKVQKLKQHGAEHVELQIYIRKTKSIRFNTNISNTCLPNSEGNT